MLASLAPWKEDAMLKLLLHSLFGHTNAGMMSDPNGGTTGG
jgi:hypothetical protein